MFKNNEPPISLFSFQDIITCLTGIMLFFLLILVIRIMEITKQLEEQSPYRAELTELQKQNALLKKQQQEISRDIDEYRKRIRDAKKNDPASLSIAKFQLERRTRELKRETDDLQKRKDLREEQKRREEQRRKQLAQKRRRLQETVASLDRIEQQNNSYRERAKELRDEIRKRKRTVNISVSGRTNKKPVALECSGDAIRIIEFDPKNVTVIRRTAPFFTEMANAAAAGLKKYPRSEYYFVLLIKPSAAGYAEYLTHLIEKEYSGADIGSEPILESEECS